MTDIKHKGIQNSTLQIVLFTVRLNTSLALSSDLSSINIRSNRHGSEMSAGHEETSCADKGVVDEFTGSTEGLVSHDEGEFCVHGGVADVFPLLDVELVDQLALSMSHLQHVHMISNEG